MKLRTGEYFISEVARSFRRNNLMSVAAVGTVAVSLFILGVFLALVLNMNHVAGSLESQVEISAYLSEELEGNEHLKLEKKILAIEGVDEVKYVDKAEAMERLRERLGDQSHILDALDEKNPLPNAIEVTVKTPEQVKKVAEAVGKIEGVEEARYGQDVVEHLFDITRLMRLFGLALMVLLTGATLFIIANTIRLTVFARRKEIAIMKYVGATDWFIRWPFILEGVVLGLIGGVIASIALRSFYSAMMGKIVDTLAFFPLLPQEPFMTNVSVAIVLAGIAIGILGSVISLKRFLEV